MKYAKPTIQILTFDNSDIMTANSNCKNSTSECDNGNSNGNCNGENYSHPDFPCHTTSNQGGAEAQWLDF